MAKSKLQKQEELVSLREKFAKSKSTIFVSQRGVTVAAIEKLRHELRKNNAELQIIKKTLLTIALGEYKVPFDAAPHDGTMALAFSYNDEVAAAREVFAFQKDHHGMKILGGFLAGVSLDSDSVAALAMLPGKEELVAKFVYVVRAPVENFTRALSGTMRGLVVSLDGIRAQKFNV